MDLTDKFNQFFQTYNGKPVEMEDPNALDQCFDLAFAWVDWINVPRETIRHPNAYQIWTEPQDITLQYFDYIPNTPNGCPKIGDIIIFNQGVGSAGHVCISNGVGDANGFTSFDQNWSGAQFAKLVTHVYTNVYGWLRVKETTDQQTLINQLRADRDKNWTLYQNEQAAKIQLEDAVNAKQTTIDNLTKENLNDKQTIQGQGDQIKTLSTSVSDLTAKNQNIQNDLDIANGLLAHRKDLYTWSWWERFSSLFGKG